jgi:hypothetical protein
MVGPRAQIHGEARLGFEHQHGDVLLRQCERHQQADRPGSYDDDLWLRWQGKSARL